MPNRARQRHESVAGRVQALQRVAVANRLREVSESIVTQLKCGEVLEAAEAGRQRRQRIRLEVQLGQRRHVREFLGQPLQPIAVQSQGREHGEPPKAGWQVDQLIVAQRELRQRA